MAAVTSLVGYRGGTLLTNTAANTTTTLQSGPSTGWAWQVTHTGLDEAGASDTGVVTVAFDTASGLTMTTTAAEANKYVLVAGGAPLFVPPDVSAIVYRALAGAPVLAVCRSANFNGNF